MHNYKVNDKVVRILPSDGPLFGAGCYRGVVTEVANEIVTIKFLCDVWRTARFEQYNGRALNGNAFIIPLHQIEFLLDEKLYWYENTLAKTEEKNNVGSE